MLSDPGGRAVGQWRGSYACLLAGTAVSDPRRGHGCLFLVSVVFCHVDISASGRSLVQKSPTECGVSEYDLETSHKEA
jgi:hypothetical protein